MNADLGPDTEQRVGTRVPVWWRRAGSRVAGVWRKAHPTPPVRKGAALGVLVFLGIVSAGIGVGLRPGLGLFDLPFGCFVGVVVAGLLALGTYLGARLLVVARDFLGWAGVAGLGGLVGVLVLIDVPPAAAIGFGLALGLIEALLGGALAVAVRGGLRGAKVAKRVAIVLIVVAGIAANGALAWFLSTRGSVAHLVKAPVETATVAPLDAPDPGQPGPYRVLSLTYGSGDHRRPEFGARAALATEPVDATPFVKGNEGFKMKARKWFWGFEPKRFPRNGRVRYPDGVGPFPLVLIVHGNHGMEEFSDPGYAYLCEHLASRGFIAVSVDENFFNGSWAGGLDTENDGRAWMLLEHLDLWKQWSSARGNPFAGKVDMGHIALIGHSRGGEAAAIAGAFNRLRYYPDDATVELPHGFAIKAIVAIAPSDGQYSPAGHPTPLEDVSYLLLQGGHDSDVSTFGGERQFERVRFTGPGPWFKAYVYAYRANHGQFNTVWGAGDLGWPRDLILNVKPLLSGDEQRRLGKAAITAFLEDTLMGKTVYSALFRDLRRGAGWLPRDVYLTRFVDASFEPVADYTEDVDVTTATVPGATIAGRGLAVWREQRLPWRQGDTRQISVAYVGWREAAGAKDKAGTADPPSYAISLPGGLATSWRLGADSILAFSAAAADEQPPEPEDKAEADDKGKKPAAANDAAKKPAKDVATGPIDFSVELVDGGGTAVRLPLSRFRALTPPLKSRFTKLPKEGGLYGKSWEPVLQSFELPLAAFAARSPGFDSAGTTAVRFVFDRSPMGVIILGDIGFARSGDAPPDSATSTTASRQPSRTSH